MVRRGSPVRVRKRAFTKAGVAFFRCRERREATDTRRRRTSNGQSTVTIGDHATGESYAIAHHLFSEEGNRMIMVASLRYLDTFAKIEGSWYFAERNLLLDWSETRPSTPGT